MHLPDVQCYTPVDEDGGPHQASIWAQPRLGSRCGGVTALWDCLMGYSRGGLLALPEEVWLAPPEQDLSAPPEQAWSAPPEQAWPLDSST